MRMRTTSPEPPPPNQLFTVYHNIFSTKAPEARARRFQELASACLRTGADAQSKAFEAFRDFLVELAGDPEWRPTAEQIEALSYLLGTDRNLSLVRPWNGENAW
jgi:hypothetical protein